MKSIWSYGNVFLMGVATALLWVKWSGRWNENKNNFSVLPPAQLENAEAKVGVTVPEMVEILKSPEAVEKLKAGYTPKFKNGKVTDWELKASLSH